MAAIKNHKGTVDDKAANKCHSAARKYFLLGLLQVPVGDLPDADSDDDPAPGENGDHLDKRRDDKAKLPPPMNRAELIDSIRDCLDGRDFENWIVDHNRDTDALSDADRKEVRTFFMARQTKIKNSQKERA